MLTDDPRLVIDRCFADLQSNAAADTILAELRLLEPAVADPLCKARLLHARAIASNRLGFAGEALGDLHEAAAILAARNESFDETRELPKIFRTIALVHSWRGESREAALALLRAIAEADPSEDRGQIALALIEAGRLQMEIGHPNDARALVRRGLDSGGAILPALERQRAWVSLLQARVAAGDLDEARRQIEDEAALRDAPPRLHVLAQIERARIHRLEGDAATAAEALTAAAAQAPADVTAFEHVEIAEARAELLLHEKKAAAAIEVLSEVVSRYADDDLASREVVARFRLAQAYDAVGETEEAGDMLAAALRRALDRGLSGYVDEARSRLAARGAAEDTWRGDQAPRQRLYARATADRFVRRRPIGAGGFASVMRAYDLELGVEVALKKSALENVYDTAKRKRLLQAARTELVAASRIAHPGVARIYGLLTEENGDAILVEEFIDGISLRQAMAERMERQRALTILSRLAFAIAAVHDAGILHRDIKPENILLRPGDAPVVVDFGIALLATQVHQRGRAGTLTYMSPEQARGDELDQRSDLYSLALVACEMLLGKLPSNAAGLLSAAWMNVSGMRRLKAMLIGEGLDSGAAQMLARSLSPHRHWRPSSVAPLGRTLARSADAAKPADR